jgi:hypothetical protein
MSSQHIFSERFFPVAQPAFLDDSPSIRESGRATGYPEVIQVAHLVPQPCGLGTGINASLDH